MCFTQDFSALDSTIDDYSSRGIDIQQTTHSDATVVIYATTDNSALDQVSTH